jgi:hypothetical protein
MVQRITSIHAMAVAKKKPAETEGAKVPAAVDTMPDILLYLEKKDSRTNGFTSSGSIRCPKDTAAQLVWES